MEKVIFNDPASGRQELLAVIVRDSECNEGYNFISENEWELQVGFNNYAAQAVCKPHEHLLRERVAKSAMEVLHISRGAIELDFYWKDQKVSTHRLGAGDTVTILQGGHGLKMLEPTKIFEIKQGPYISRELDKRFFDV